MGVLVWAVAGDCDWTSPVTLSGFGVAVLLLSLFIAVERRGAHPLMPLRLFRSRNLVGANLFGFMISAGQLAAFYFCSLFMQQVWGTSGTLTGVLLLPFCAFVVLGIAMASRLATAVGERATLGILGVLGTTGMYWFSLLPREFSFWRGLLLPSPFAAVGTGGTIGLAVLVPIAAQVDPDVTGEGYRTGLAWGAGLLLVGAVIAVLVVPKHQKA